MVEVWKPIEGYEGVYEVSSFGNVKSLNRVSAGREFKGRVLKGRLDNRGYLITNLSKDGKTRTPKVHRLVAEAFISNPENKEQVNHIDGDKTNNHISNLEWNTRSENMRHAFAMGLVGSGVGSGAGSGGGAPKGSSNGKAKLTEEDVIAIREEYSHGETSYSKLGQKYEVSRQAINDIVNRKRWAHI